jgi:hypothetical protein
MVFWRGKLNTDLLGRAQIAFAKAGVHEVQNGKGRKL